MDENNTINNTSEQTEEKVYSSDYVKAIRNESARYRTRAKTYETSLKQILGVENLDDLSTAIEQHNQAIQSNLDAAIAKANKRMIDAEFKALTANYNAKLLNKVIDMSNVNINDDGVVVGLKEAIEAAEQEFPEVKKTGSNPQLASGTGRNNTTGSITGVEAAFMAKNPGIKI